MPSPERVRREALGPQVMHRLRKFAKRAEDANTPEGRAIHQTYTHFRSDYQPWTIWISAPLPLSAILRGIWNHDPLTTGIGFLILGTFLLIYLWTRRVDPLRPNPRADLVAIALPFLGLQPEERVRVERLLDSSGVATT